VATALVLACAIATPAAAQKAPKCEVKAKVAPENQTVSEGTTVGLNGEPSQDESTYLWEQQGGPAVTLSSTTTDKPSFVAPEVGPDGATVTLRLTVTGCTPVQTSSFITTITVNNVNHRPTALIAVSPATAFENDAVTLDGSGSYDPDGDPLTYAWSQVSGTTVAIDHASSAVAAFTAPTPAQTLTFRLRVTDPDGLYNEVDTIVSVQHVNLPPTLSLSCPAMAGEGGAVTLIGTAQDDGGPQPLTYSWSQTDGGPPVDAPSWSDASLVFAAPSLSLHVDGLLTFKLIAGDGELGAEATCQVQILDVTPPVVTVPEDTTVEATGADGAQVTFMPMPAATDAHDGDIEVVDCRPASGTLFALGDTAVMCSARDAEGNEGSATFTVTVHDTTPPDLTLPGDVDAEATGRDGATVEFEAAAWDLVDGSVAVTCTPESGILFGFGRATVSCTATDAAGNQASGSFVVTVADTTPPAITVPSDIVAEATSRSGAAVTFEATAKDVVDGDVPVRCTPSSGSTFALGETTITCKATDAAGNEGSATFKVTVRDTTPPSLTLPADITLEATGPSGAVATFTASSTDIVDGEVSVTCTPASGATFALGDTSVTCTAKDAAGNQARGDFKVAVVDTTPPSLTLPANITTEATGPAGAAVTFSATATDLVDGSVAVTCAPASGSTFALGETTVRCSATDAHHNTASGEFNLTVVDTTPPSLTLPANITTEATGPFGAAVTFAATATDLVDGNVAVTCSPASGSAFPIATTQVSCTATDVHGNAASGGFAVTVQDTTPPAIASPGAVTSIYGSASYYATPTATDLVDGVRPVSCSPQPTDRLAPGPSTITCGASDTRGNSATITFTVAVVFNTACNDGPGHQVLQPIEFTGASVFPKKAGSTVPTKFRVCDAQGNSIGSINPVSSFQLVQVTSGTVVTTPNEDVVSTSADSSFRWSGAFWIFNLSTKPYSAGATYKFRIGLIDGTSIDFQFGLK